MNKPSVQKDSRNSNNASPRVDIDCEISLRSLFGSFATGVIIATAQDHDGNQAAVTANSFTSVSMSPPLILFCLSRNAGSVPVFERTPEFSIHILGDHQTDLARICAKPGVDKLKKLRSKPSSARGGPRLQNVLSRIDCQRYSMSDGGDHIVVMGEVVGGETAQTTMEPLVFHQGIFSNLKLRNIT